MKRKVVAVKDTLSTKKSKYYILFPLDIWILITSFLDLRYVYGLSLTCVFMYSNRSRFLKTKEDFVEALIQYGIFKTNRELLFYFERCKTTTNHKHIKYDILGHVENFDVFGKTELRFSYIKTQYFKIYIPCYEFDLVPLHIKISGIGCFILKALEKIKSFMKDNGIDVKLHCNIVIISQSQKEVTIVDSFVDGDKISDYMETICKFDEFKLKIPYPSDLL